MAKHSYKKDNLASNTQQSKFQFKANMRFKNKKQKDMYTSILSNRITFVRSPAGTGKTFIALLAALELIRNPKYNINNIILTKPIVEISSSKGLGHLPGTVDEKTSVYFAHFYDNLTKIIGEKSIKFLKDSGVLKECVLNYIRGITFGTYDDNQNPIGSVCILDESQNCTSREMQAFISRMGEGSKLIILGDSDQIDIRLQNYESCGLDDAIYRLGDLDSVAVVEFDENDIVRDPFLIEIMKRYKKKDNNT